VQWKGEEWEEWGGKRTNEEKEENKRGKLGERKEYVVGVGGGRWSCEWEKRRGEFVGD
jgi:hypothetical protein